MVGSSVEKFGSSWTCPGRPVRGPCRKVLLASSAASCTIFPALSLKFGNFNAFGFVFCAICDGGFSGCFRAACGFGGSGVPEPARACSVVSPCDALGCASGRAPSAITSSGPITGGGGGGGCC